MKSFIFRTTLILLSTTFQIASIASDIAWFPFYKTASFPEDNRKKTAVCYVDEELFRFSEPDYSNVRLFDEAGNEQPFLVRPAKTVKTVTIERKLDIGVISFQKLPDNKVEIICATGKESGDRKLSSIQFVTALKNYEKKVSVFGGNDRESWDVLLENSPIFDYSGYIDLRNSRVSVPPCKYAFYRIIVSNITESHESPIIGVVSETQAGQLKREIEKREFQRENLRFDQIDFFEVKDIVKRDSIVTRLYKLENLSVATDDGKTTILFNALRTPLTSLQIITDSSNFIRTFRVDVRNEKTGVWRQISAGSISKIDIGGFKRNNTHITLNRVIRTPEMRVVIDNMDNPPLDILDVEAKGEVHEIVFFPGTTPSFRVLYGADNIPPPRYDIAGVLSMADGAEADIWILGPRENNEQFNLSVKKPVNGQKIFVISVLCAVLVLLWVMFKVLKKV